MSDIHTINTATGTVTPPAPSVPTVPPASRSDITSVTPPAPQAPWHANLDPDIKTYALQKGYDLSDPAKAFVYAAKGHIEAQKFLGVPPQQLLRLPADVNDEAGWNAIYQRFGKPLDKSGYDLSKVKFADGTDLDAPFAEFMREKAFELHLPTTSAAALTQAFVGYMEQSDRRELEGHTAKLAEEKALLAKEWGANYEYNRQMAVTGAQKLRVSQEDVNALEKVVGYGRVMEMFRKVGSGSSEDAFVSGKQGGEFMTSAQSAQARLIQLQENPEWRAKLAAGDPGARAENEQLCKVISGYVEEAGGL